MKVIKNRVNNYVLNCYKTKKYVTMHLSFLFEMEYTKKNIFLLDLLDEYMLNTNAKYKTKKEISRVFKENYNLGMMFKNYNVGKKMFIEAEYTFFDPTLIEDKSYFENVLNLASDFLFKPNFIEGKLDKKTLEYCKNIIIDSYASNLMEGKYRAGTHFYDKILPNTYMTEDIIHSKEEITELLNSYTDQEFIDMYNKVLNESFVGAILMGNINDKIIERIGELFKFKKVKDLEYDYNQVLSLCDKEPFINEKDDSINESIVYLAFDCKNYNIKKKYVYILINMMLNSGLLLHKTLRTELKIAYKVGSIFNSRSGFFTAHILIDRKNIDKCVEGFDIVLEKLKEERVVEPLLKQMKEKINISDYISDENKWNVYDELFNKAFKAGDTKNVANKIINKITTEEIINAVNNIERKVVYFYEGTGNEK